MSHGGDVYRIAERLGVPERRVMDFSASINPLGMPKSSIKEIKKAMSSLGNYPDLDAGIFALKVSDRFGLEPGRVLVGNGSTELIYLILRALSPHRVLVTSPAFSEYERASRAAGAKVFFLKVKRKNGYRIEPCEYINAMKGADLAFLCNPNNPTGDVLERDEVMEVAKSARREKCLLVVDEAFIDFVPGASVLGVRDNPYLIVLRSMTKFYAMAGLRLGFGYFPAGVAGRLRAFKEPWSVNTLAERAGAAALDDTKHARMTFELMDAEKRYLEKRLGKIGLKYYPSRVNFYLIETGRANEVVSGLLDKRLLVRDCSNFRGLGNGHIRIAVRSRRDNAMLLNGLSDVL
ncbi:MAG: threonine-phosphate decarboxylase [Nitrospirae bacterium]|nr:threonine-phosphate decarboxylase [Nitrospirota bacterium]